MKKFTIGSLFTGISGIDIGFKKAGFDIVNKVVNLLPESIRVNLKENSYNIYIGKSFLELVNFLPEVKSKRVLIVTDTNVEKLYLQDFILALEKKDFVVSYLVIIAGEKSKNFEVLNKIYNSCIENNLDRKSLIIAFGGGVIGDMAGFEASTYLRGIDFIQVPTTLLAQVDASIGGKTGIDLEIGKNLVGSFYQPKLVWIDPQFLKTLDDREFKNGLAEVIKYGMIYLDCDIKESFWGFLEENIDKILDRNDDDILKKMLFLSAKAKAIVVSKDEKEGDLRKILNFGHTLGHARETYQNYSGLKHGEAVAFGMAFAAYLAVEMKICEKEVEVKLLKLLNKAGFQIEEWKREIFVSHDVYDKICYFMAHDKKMSVRKIDFILPESIGKVKIVPLELDFIKKILINWGSNGQN